MMGSIMAFSKSVMNEKIADKFGDIRLSFEQVEELCSPISDSYEKMSSRAYSKRSSGCCNNGAQCRNRRGDKRNSAFNYGKRLKKYESFGEVSLDNLPDFENQINTSINKIDAPCPLQADPRLPRKRRCFLYCRIFLILNKIDELLDEQTFGAASLLEEYFSLDGIDENERNALNEITDFGTSLESL